MTIEIVKLYKTSLGVFVYTQDALKNREMLSDRGYPVGYEEIETIWALKDGIRYFELKLLKVKD